MTWCMSFQHWEAQSFLWPSKNGKKLCPIMRLYDGMMYDLIQVTITTKWRAPTQFHTMDTTSSALPYGVET